MAEQIRAPTSDEAVAGTWTGSAGSRFGVVDDYPDTAGTDELTHGTTAGTLTFGFSAFTLPAGATSITVLVDYYDYKNGSQSCTFGARLKVGASYFNASTHNPGNGSANRTQRTDTWATNPATSAAWTVDQVNGTAGSNNLVAFGYNSGSDANPTITTSSIQLRVTYTDVTPVATGAITVASTSGITIGTPQTGLVAGAIEVSATSGLSVGTSLVGLMAGAIAFSSALSTSITSTVEEFSATPVLTGAIAVGATSGMSVGTAQVGRLTGAITTAAALSMAVPTAQLGRLVGAVALSSSLSTSITASVETYEGGGDSYVGARHLRLGIGLGF